MIDLKLMRRVAEEAQPGRWSVDTLLDGEDCVRAFNGPGCSICTGIAIPEDHQYAIQNHLHVVQAQPANVIELLDTIEAQAAEIERLRVALALYASRENWEKDQHGVERLWLEPDSSTRDSYHGFELAAIAIAKEKTS